MFSYFDKVKNDKEVKLLKQFRQNIIQNELETDLTQIIEIDNFPDDLDQDLQKLLNIREGMSGLYKDDAGEIFTVSVTPAGLPRKDGRPNKVIVRYINNEKVEVKEAVNDVNVVLWYNTDFALPDYNSLRYAHILAEVDISILANVKRSRLNPLIRVKNALEKAQIDEALKNSDVDYGKPATYISDETLKDLMKQGENGGSSYLLNFSDVSDASMIQYLSNLNLELRNRFFSKYGLTMNSSGGKMAEQTTAEIKGAEAASWVIPCSMLKQAKAFCERANKLFGLEMSAHFGTIHELNYMSFANDCSNDNGVHEDVHDAGAEVVEEKEEKENADNSGDLPTETSANE